MIILFYLDFLFNLLEDFIYFAYDLHLKNKFREIYETHISTFKKKKKEQIWF